MALEWRGPALDVRAVRAQCRKATPKLAEGKISIEIWNLNPEVDISPVCINQ